MNNPIMLKDPSGNRVSDVGPLGRLGGDEANTAYASLQSNISVVPGDDVKAAASQTGFGSLFDEEDEYETACSRNGCGGGGRGGAGASSGPAAYGRSSLAKSLNDRNARQINGKAEGKLQQPLSGRAKLSPPNFTNKDFPNIANKVSPQKQARHIAGHKNYRHGGTLSLSDAQKLLNAFHSGATRVLGKSKNGGFPVVRYDGVTGRNNNLGVGVKNEPTNTFMIKGTKSPSVVPVSPFWKP